MNRMFGSPKTALIDIDRSTEFTGDDVDRYSKLVDLLDIWENVEVTIPALDSSGVVSLYLQHDGDEDTVPGQFIALGATAAGHFVPSTTSGAGDITVVFKGVFAQFLRVHVGANQAADRTFSVRGC